MTVQTFKLGPYTWDINDAKRLVAGREPVQRDVTCWVEQVSDHNINDEHWPTVDLSQPLIVVSMPETGDLQVIDGLHRVRRAIADGVATLSVHFLSPEEELSVRRYGPGDEDIED